MLNLQEMTDTGPAGSSQANLTRVESSADSYSVPQLLAKMSR